MTFFIGFVFGALIAAFIIWLLNQLPDVIAEKSQSTACMLAEQYKKMSETMYQQYLKMKEKCEGIERAGSSTNGDNNKKDEEQKAETS